MKRTFYGFKPVALSTVELAYDTNLNQDCYYIQMERNDYPCIVAAKFSMKNELIEFYPIYISSLKNSMDIIIKQIRYLGTYDYRHYAYMSWDLKNLPNEIYLPKGKGYIEKYKDDKLDAKYYTIYDLSELDKHPLLTDKIKNFVRQEKPDVFMYVTKNEKLKRICNIFNFSNDKYLEKRLKVQALQDTWT